MAKNILIADDSAFMRLTLRDILTKGGYDVAGEAERREFRRELVEALDSLPPRQRAVFVATELGGQTFKDLSIQWNEPIGTLLSRKCRAVKALRETLQNYKP